MNLEESFIPSHVGADTLWELGHEGQDVGVAFIDSGVVEDPSFKEQIIETKDFSGHHDVYNDNNWHGSSMVEAMLVVAPKAKLGVFKVTDKHQFPSKNAVMQALQYCLDVYPKYRVINMSLSFAPNNCPDHCELCQLVDQAYAKGLLITVAAGNKGYKEGQNTITCPGRARWALTSIATLPKFQNDYLDKRCWLQKTVMQISGKMSRTYGTSFSSAYSAGYAALIFSAFPKLTADTYRYFALQVSHEIRKQGRETLKVDDVYNKLENIKYLSSIAMVTKPGALYPMVEKF